MLPFYGAQPDSLKQLGKQNKINSLLLNNNQRFVASFVDPNTLYPDPDPEFWPNSDPDPGLCY